MKDGRLSWLHLPVALLLLCNIWQPLHATEQTCPGQDCAINGGSDVCGQFCICTIVHPTKTLEPSHGVCAGANDYQFNRPTRNDMPAVPARPRQPGLQGQPHLQTTPHQPAKPTDAGALYQQADYEVEETAGVYQQHSPNGQMGGGVGSAGFMGGFQQYSSQGQMGGAFGTGRLPGDYQQYSPHAQMGSGVGAGYFPGGFQQYSQYETMGGGPGYGALQGGYQQYSPNGQSTGNKVLQGLNIGMQGVMQTLQIRNQMAGLSSYPTHGAYDAGPLPTAPLPTLDSAHGTTFPTPESPQPAATTKDHARAPPAGRPPPVPPHETPLTPPPVPLRGSSLSAPPVPPRRPPLKSHNTPPHGSRLSTPPVPPRGPLLKPPPVPKHGASLSAPSVPSHLPPLKPPPVPPRGTSRFSPGVPARGPPLKPPPVPPRGSSLGLGTRPGGRPLPIKKPRLVLPKPSGWKLKFPKFRKG